MSNQPKIEDLEKLGKEGKLWGIEIIYQHRSEAKRLTYRNQTNEQIMKIRDAIFRVGFVIPVKDQHGVIINGSFQIIPPLDIVEVFLHRQTGYFYE